MRKLVHIEMFVHTYSHSMEVTRLFSVYSGWRQTTLHSGALITSSNTGTYVHTVHTYTYMYYVFAILTVYVSTKKSSLLSLQHLLFYFFTCTLSCLDPP